MSTRLFVTCAAVIFVAIVTIGSTRFASTFVAQLNVFMTAVTLAIVALQLLLNIEQTALANRQSEIIEKQDALLFGKAMPWIYAPSAVELGIDELSALEKVELFARNDGHRVAKGLVLRISVPSVFEIEGDLWQKLTESHERQDGCSVYERPFDVEVWPSATVALTTVNLHRSTFRRTESQVCWQLRYDGGLVPASGDFVPLRGSADPVG